MICRKVRPRDALFIILLGVCYVNAAANILPVPLKYNDPGKSYWCWAAASQGVLEYYGYYNSQSEIAAYGTNGVDTWNYLFFSDDKHQAVDRILAKFSHYYLSPRGIGASLDRYTLIRSINDNRSPVTIAWWLSMYSIGHTVVIKGVDLDYATFVVMDPTRGEISGSYNWLLEEDGHEWVESLTIGMGKESSFFADKALTQLELDVISIDNEKFESQGLSEPPDWDGVRLSR